jgi:hypothetical protein
MQLQFAMEMDLKKMSTRMGLGASITFDQPPEMEFPYGESE